MFADSNGCSRIVSSRPGERLPLHRHHEARLILFGPGLTVERSFDGEAWFAEGDLLFRPAYYGHANLAGPEGSQYLQLRVSATAARSRLQPYELSRRFATEFGLAPRAFRRQAGLQRAMRMLIEDAGGLADIAVATGFCDQSHLTRCLKLETGLTPRAFARAVAR